MAVPPLPHPIPFVVKAAPAYVAWDMNGVNTADIQPFKIRAISPFVPNLKAYLATQQTGEPATALDISVRKLVSWVVRILDEYVELQVKKTKSEQTSSKTDVFLAAISPKAKPASKKAQAAVGKTKKPPNTTTSSRGRVGTAGNQASKPVKPQDDPVRTAMTRTDRRRGRESSTTDPKLVRAPKVVGQAESIGTLHSEMLSGISCKLL